jgi:hypothetical protein
MLSGVGWFLYNNVEDAYTCKSDVMRILSPVSGDSDACKRVEGVKGAMQERERMHKRNDEEEKRRKGQRTLILFSSDGASDEMFSALRFSYTCKDWSTTELAYARTGWHTFLKRPRDAR